MHSSLWGLLSNDVFVDSSWGFSSWCSGTLSIVVSVEFIPEFHCCLFTYFKYFSIFFSFILRLLFTFLLLYGSTVPLIFQLTDSLLESHSTGEFFISPTNFFISSFLFEVFSIPLTYPLEFYWLSIPWFLLVL